jgi:hypothetical protein
MSHRKTIKHLMSRSNWGSGTSLTPFLLAFGHGNPRPSESLFVRHFLDRVLNRPFNLLGTVIVVLPQLDPLPRFILRPTFTFQSQLTRKLYYVVERLIVPIHRQSGLLLGQPSHGLSSARSHPHADGQIVGKQFEEREPLIISEFHDLRRNCQCDLLNWSNVCVQHHRADGRSDPFKTGPTAGSACMRLFELRLDSTKLEPPENGPPTRPPPHYSKRSEVKCSVVIRRRVLDSGVSESPHASIRRQKASFAT